MPTNISESTKVVHKLNQIYYNSNYYTLQHLHRNHYLM